MSSQYLNSHSGLELLKRLAAGLTILALILMPIYPLQVVAQSSPEASTSEAETTAEGGVPPEAVNVPAEEPVAEEIAPEPQAEPEPSPTDETVIETGDAVAETEIINEVNVNIAETEAAPVLEVSTDNEAVVENESETAAGTGENTATSTSGSAEITTGNAYSSANVISVVNLNLINSSGFLYLLNNFLQSLGHIDLRPLTSTSFETSSNPNPCGEIVCEAAITDLSVQASSTAEILNAIIVRSSTGVNLAQGNGASITTGNAYAGANVANIVNTNIIDSNYLLFAFNNFGAWDGDLIFPNSDFFSSFFSPLSFAAGAQVSNTNSADVESEVEISAETGDNESESDESSIETGDALAGANITNVINTNLFNTSTFFVIFRIFGSWNGSVFNAPDGISWAETPSGIELFSADEAGGAGFSTSSESSSGGGHIKVETANTARIANNVKVFALTGANKATGFGGAAGINTGHAYAGANVLNIANTNVVSSNWVIALINIFGDWGGNISFGQPDLWVATQAEGPETLTRGSEVAFHTTVANRGDASASAVRFNGRFNSPFIGFENEDSGDSYSWNIGDLAPGEIKEFSYDAKVNNSLPFGDTLIDHTFEVSANETDGNPADNTDTVSLLARILRRPSGRISTESVTKTTTYPYIQISKTNAADGSIVASSTVEYTIVVENNGGSAFNGVLHDVLKDEDGNVITENSWELGEIFGNEEITVTYTAAFSASTTPGVYTNYAWVEAYGGDYTQDPALGTSADSSVASSVIVVADNSEGAVLGESCGFYLDEFIRQGMDNDIGQVMKLQEFLNRQLGANLPVTGFYGSLTFQAVKVFQEKYAEEILVPWGLESPTGIVYQTTLRWINQLECPQLSLEIPPLIAWSKNPNTPLALANTGSSLSLNPISPAKLDDENESESENISDGIINDTKKEKNLLASSVVGLISFLKSIFGR